MKNANKKGKLVDRPKNKKHSHASYQFQSMTGTGNQLPDPRRYFRALGMELKPVNEPLHVSTCPICGFIDGMLMRPTTGAWRCTGCGSHGNGIIALHMQLHGVNYAQAVEQIAALAEVSQ